MTTGKVNAIRLLERIIDKRVIEFDSMSKRLAKDVIWLMRSNKYKYTEVKK